MQFNFHDAPPRVAAQRRAPLRNATQRISFIDLSTLCVAAQRNAPHHSAPQLNATNFFYQFYRRFAPICPATLRTAPQLNATILFYQFVFAALHHCVPQRIAPLHYATLRGTPPRSAAQRNDLIFTTKGLEMTKAGKKLIAAAEEAVAIARGEADPASYRVHNLDLIWGAENIAKAIGRPVRATFHMLEKGNLPARRVGGRWCVSRAALVKFFDSEDAQQ